MLKPLHDYVVLEKVKEEVKTKSGIILTTGEAKEAPSMGLVIAVGPGKVEDGKLIKIDLKEGQKVIYKKYSGTEVTYDKKDYLLIRAEEILAIVD
ncbi:MAG: co-chaperone GroES [Solobacterium sp.]|nr:co-chaperone GroES [Solobacterium sp.]MBQ1320313.1 co-chaperone GroES [Solobacterium sp.]MBQ1355548.1 co-chaperone GroES [Solobacterium sp.]